MTIQQKLTESQACKGMITGALKDKIREGNGTPLQQSCLEDPMDGGAWLTAVHGVAKSRTRLTRLSSSSKG